MVQPRVHCAIDAAGPAAAVLVVELLLRKIEIVPGVCCRCEVQELVVCACCRPMVPKLCLAQQRLPRDAVPL